MTAQTRSVGYAVAKLRTSVLACCCLVGLSLIVQVIIWSLVSFTDLRMELVEPEIAGPLVVESSDLREQPTAVSTSTAVSFKDVREPIVVLTSYDQFFNDFAALSQSVGTAACLVLLPLVLVGTLLAAAAGSPNVHDAISAMIWVTLIGVLSIPVAEMFQLPWNGGALRPYESMVALVEEARASGGGGFLFWARFLILPAFCGIGSLLVMWRFARAMDPLMPSELHKLDPELERETANISVTSLHGGGGRTAGALSRVVKDDSPAPAFTKSSGGGGGGKSVAGIVGKAGAAGISGNAGNVGNSGGGGGSAGSARAVPQGEAPRRII